MFLERDEHTKKFKPVIVEKPIPCILGSVKLGCHNAQPKSTGQVTMLTVNKTVDVRIT